MKPNMYRFILSAALLLSILPNCAHGAQTLVVAFSQFPPYKMLVDGKAAGIDLDILKEIGSRMDFAISVKNGTFEECLGMMKRGEADLMSSLLFRGEREQYIIYVQPRYRAKSDKIFYVLKGSEKSIRQFDDLKHFRIGVKAGVSYAPLFDTAKELDKVAGQSIKENIAKLLAGQIDTFIATDTEGDYWIKTMRLQDKIVKSIFKFQQLDPVYMGISKKSQFKNEAKKFGRNLKYLIDHGIVQRIVDQYTQ